MLEALRGYVQLATGLTEVTVTKAREAASSLLGQGLELGGVSTHVPGADQAAGAAKAAATQVQGLADELVETSKQNRELLVGLVRTEVERAAGRMGYVREEELAAVRRHVSRLETQLAEVRSHIAGAAADPAPAPQADAGADVEAPQDEAAEAPAAGTAPKRKKKVVVAPEDQA